MEFEDEAEAGEGVPAPVPPTGIASKIQRPAKAPPPPPVFHPLAYRNVIAEWPVEWRERWGRRANALEENGLSWRDAEAQAFVEVWAQIRAEQNGQPAAVSPATTEAERN